MYQNIKDLQEEIDNFTPKNIIDYILHGSQLNRWFKSIKNNKDNKFVKAYINNPPPTK